MRAPYAVVVLVALALAGCGGDDGGGEGGTARLEPPSQSVVEPSTTPPGIDTALRDELVAMLERDQGNRLGTAVNDETDDDRTARLKEIIAEHGWPGYDLVGKEGEDAAWAIAQHSDLDPAFQAEALELLRAAVEDGQASPGNLAYLEDRVAVGKGEPQTYGTQVSCAAGGPVPQTPIRDRAGLEERRAAADIGTYADYLTEMSEICSSAG